jgi:hypothetical protein
MLQDVLDYEQVRGGEVLGDDAFVTHVQEGCSPPI